MPGELAGGQRSEALKGAHRFLVARMQLEQFRDRAMELDLVPEAPGCALVSLLSPGPGPIRQGLSVDFGARRSTLLSEDT